MAAARDQAARILRSEPDSVESEAVRETAATMADPTARAQPSEDTVSRRTSEMPEKPAVTRPAPSQVASAAKAGRQIGRASCRERV